MKLNYDNPGGRAVKQCPLPKPIPVGSLECVITCKHASDFDSKNRCVECRYPVEAATEDQLPKTTALLLQLNAQLRTENKKLLKEVSYYRGLIKAGCDPSELAPLMERLVAVGETHLGKDFEEKFDDMRSENERLQEELAKVRLQLDQIKSVLITK